MLERTARIVAAVLHDDAVVGGPAPFALSIAGEGTEGLLASAPFSRQRPRAAQVAGDAWQPCDHGTVHVSTHGFYLDLAGTLLAFRWGCIQHMSLRAPGVVWLTAEMATGAVETYLLTSEAAEMVFALWCLAAYRTHPQFTGLEWLRAFDEEGER